MSTEIRIAKATAAACAPRGARADARAIYVSYRSSLLADAPHLGRPAVAYRQLLSAGLAIQAEAGELVAELGLQLREARRGGQAPQRVGRRGGGAVDIAAYDANAGAGRGDI